MLETQAAYPIVSRSQEGDQERFLLFELDTRGHYPGYIQHLVTYWCQHNLPGQLDILVSPKFIQQHHNIVKLAESSPTVRFISITEAEDAALFNSFDLAHSFRGRIVRAFQEWRLLRKYALSLKTTHIFVMYLDTVLLRLTLNVTLPCPVSAIYFRPILHYGTFPNYLPEGKESVWQWRDRLCLARFLPYSNLQTLFCLDPFAVEYINQVYSTTKAVYLPDPVQRYTYAESEYEQLKTRLSIQSNRTVFLLFGALSSRKGLSQVLDAIALLPPALCQRMTLLLVGPMEEPQQLEAQIAELTKAKPIQIITEHRFVPDEAIHPYFQVSDVVLVPYQRHIGMSAILVRAAVAGKPVLASDFGLVGELTRHYQLGLSVDSTSPEEIAKGMTRYLLEIPNELCDPVQQKQFADRNTAEQFASQIFQCLQLSSPRRNRSFANPASDYSQLSNSQVL